jgi:ABC-type nickel/cobalt efflux system permease component RcnA
MSNLHATVAYTLLLVAFIVWSLWGIKASDAVDWIIRVVCVLIMVAGIVTAWVSYAYNIPYLRIMYEHL